MSTTVIELENKDIVVKMSGQGPMGPRGRQGEPGPAGPSEWGVIQGNISNQTDLQNALDAKADVGVSYTKSEEDALLAQKADADSVYTKTETDSLLADKADTDNVYSKTEVNTLLSGKADADTVYTKTEADTLLDAKADVGDSYTKAEEDTLLAVKANSADVYTKTQTDTLLADKADADTVYTKTETDSLLSNKADSADVYTKTETDALLLDKAPVIISSASGSIVSFTDGSPAPVTALSVSIDPVQDLHGYDNPWPAGGGKNLFDPSKAEVGKNWNGNAMAYSIVTDYIPVTVGNTYIFSVSNMQKYTGIVTAFFDANKTYISTGTSTTINPSGNETFVRVSIRCANTDTWTDTDLANAKIQIEKGSTATPWTPYSNICPISGHDTATVTRTGKNLLNNIASTVIQDGLTYTVNDDKSVTVSGTRTNTTQDASAIILGTLNVKKGQQLTINGSVTGYNSTTGAQIFSTSSKAFPLGNRLQTYNGNEITRTALADDTITVRIYIYTTETINITFYPMIRFASVADSTYEPYQGTSVTIDLDGTRYGGELNVLTGEMTVDRVIVDLGQLSWSTRYTGNSNKTLSTTLATNFPLEYNDYSFVSENYAYRSYVTAIVQLNDPDNKSISIYAYYNNSISERNVIYIVIDKNTSPSGNMVYRIATPFTVQLTPNQLSTLLGENHVWADTGDTSVEYRADTRMYIDQSLQSQSNALKLMLTPNVETEMKASKNYTSWSIVIVNNDFIKLTSAVASGANLVIGSNCIKTTMAEWVASLTA